MISSGRWAPTGAFLGVLASILIGCQSPPGGETDDGVSAIQFKDIPVPSGLRLREQNHASDSLEMGGYRYANFVYAGTVSIADVSAYLRERMPQHSWQLESEENDLEGNEKLSFRRGKYVAECTLEKAPNQPMTQLDVTVRTTIEPAK